MDEAKKEAAVKRGFRTPEEAMIMPPMMRVERPQEVWWGMAGLFSLSEKVMPKARAKPSPK